MQDKLLKSLQALAMAGTVAFAAGCTVTGTETVAEVDPLAEVREIANEALRTANTAAYNASTAKDLALAAQASADAAQARCDASTRRMNVMFQDSMKGK